MNIIDRVVIKQFHQMRTREFGEGTSQALGYYDQESHLLRFKMLAGIGNMNDSSVLDAGCGYGDLNAYLREKYSNIKYEGIDQSEEFLAAADQRYGHLPDTTFYLGDFYSSDLPIVDYVLACGSLNYRSSDQDFIYKMIERLFNVSRIALGFNLLSNVTNTTGVLASYNADDIVRYCLTLTDNMKVHDKYLAGDFTIWMYKRV